jgi:hypothetical protein
VVQISAWNDFSTVADGTVKLKVYVTPVPAPAELDRVTFLLVIWAAETLEGDNDRSIEKLSTVAINIFLALSENSLILMVVLLYWFIF